MSSGYRILADENIERATRRYLAELGHDITWVGDVDDVGLGADDEDIARYARRVDCLILTQDDDFFTEFDTDETAGVLFQRDQALSTQEVGDAVHEMSRYLDQSEVTLEYVSQNWL